jgi:hypothetical protein
MKPLSLVVLGTGSLLGDVRPDGVFVPDQSRLCLVAHHSQLYPPRTAEDEAVAWLDESPIPDLTTLYPLRVNGGKVRRALIELRTDLRARTEGD